MEGFTYTVIRSDRKTLAIRVLADGSVEVRTPLRVPKEEIEKFLKEKENWIRKHREEAEKHRPESVEHRKILFKGVWKEIRPAEEYKVWFDGEFFYAPAELDPYSLRYTMEDLMKKLAKRELVPMVYLLSAAVGVRPERVTITGAKTKWGSCSDGKNINLSWRLMAAPVQEIEYVIFHELCHMKEMNHSADFWALVEKYVPDWRERRERLTQVQAWLTAYYG